MTRPAQTHCCKQTGQVDTSSSMPWESYGHYCQFDPPFEVIVLSRCLQHLAQELSFERHAGHYVSAICIEAAESGDSYVQHPDLRALAGGCSVRVMPEDCCGCGADGRGSRVARSVNTWRWHKLKFAFEPRTLRVSKQLHQENKWR